MNMPIRWQFKSKCHVIYLSSIVESQEDPRTYAEAKLREAEALDDRDAKVEALMKAGLALRDRCHDSAGARAAFEQILQVRRYHRAATWALAELVEKSGDLAEAASVLEKALEDREIEPSEKARVMTQLASLARQAGVPARAALLSKSYLRLTLGQESGTTDLAVDETDHG